MAPLAHTLALLAMTLATAAIDEERMDMAPNSFDDQYRGCGPAMTAALPALNRSEFQDNPVFAQAWLKAVAEWQRKGSPVSPLSSSAQAIAVMAYSMKYVYRPFNDAVREAGSSPQEYRDNFHFKTLHFLLTQALVKLREDQNAPCRNVFRGVHDICFMAQRGQRVRFGHFTSTSLSRNVAEGYGTDTVFQVYTCHGVDIQAFSYDRGNREVLIPPYETFEVTNVTRKGDKAEIELSSTGTYSKYNCEWLEGDTTGDSLGDEDTRRGDGATHGGSVPLAPFHLGGLVLATTALAVATGIL
ncbi:erythroblast NAD(P)(+)--arginine ADP-ribosyltransferase-like [Hirundo rustica]|uniref:erythroblast NAD(P)(+)--arginine ADP-ribosyltransferase-like n=1 Tax=Hirundo rustica TaxID=43150 RepID=UPI001A940566|nr:erythroblast NAD(P)(+)--arginine ADP-ribosyltransferase-like [Hirundo rustica]